MTVKEYLKDRFDIVSDIQKTCFGLIDNDDKRSYIVLKPDDDISKFMIRTSSRLENFFNFANYSETCDQTHWNFGWIDGNMSKEYEEMLWDEFEEIHSFEANEAFDLYREQAESYIDVVSEEELNKVRQILTKNRDQIITNIGVYTARSVMERRLLCYRETVPAFVLDMTVDIACSMLPVALYMYKDLSETGRDSIRTTFDDRVDHLIFKLEDKDFCYDARPTQVELFA